MGGQIALDLVRRHPARVAGLLLADTNAAAEADRTERIEMADRLLREGMAPYAADLLHRMVRPTAPPAVRRHVHAMMTGTDPTGAAAAQRARADRPDSRAVLSAVTVPATVVVGAQDDLTPVAEARALAAALRDVELVIVDDAAHLPSLEQPDAFAAALGRLLDRVDAVGHPEPPVDGPPAGKPRLARTQTPTRGE